MAYTFTEKKRIRKDFGKRPSVLNVPNLLATQVDSYQGFLQQNIVADERIDKGLHAAFSSVLPIKSHTGKAELQYVSYRLGTPSFDVKECQLRGVTYAAPLRVKMRLVIYDKDAPAKSKIVKDIKEQEVYMGEIPLMTEKGNFVINGTERVIVSQLHRSPGVFFGSDNGKSHSSGKNVPQTKAKDDPNAAYLINSRPLRDSIEQKAPHKGIDIPSCFSFLWHNIKFSGQLSQAEKDDLFSVDLVADLGHIPFSAENNTHRQKLIADFTPRFRTGDYSLSKNSQIKKILQFYLFHKIQFLLMDFFHFLIYIC